MTNPALEAFEHICKWTSHIDPELIKIVRTALSNAPQWQPIEAAPIDERIYVAIPDIDFYDQVDLRISMKTKTGLFICCAGGGTLEDATHWMPLPTAHSRRGSDV